MIEHTFQMLPSVGRKKESSLWESGILGWEDFLSCKSVPGIKEGSKGRCDALLLQASELLDDGEARLLGPMVPKGEHWRMYERFRDKAAFLDIETDGLGRNSLVTVVTVHRKGSTDTFIEGEGLDAGALSDALDGADILVTFNGSCFDVPVLRNSFPGVDFDIPHFDLRFASRKLGHKGGLKPLETEMGISRPEDIIDVDGAMAVRLWRQWERHGDRDALDILVEYNRADTVNLEVIADRLYGRLVTEYAGYRWREGAGPLP
ncbi:MAG: ribonuclease H-like domain-containing protein [Candidatus Methanomethylophilaceae archaeon]|nr:ribonuclease H-like domain-containing protein [Candidatus Methanomethylophilaceae archaeon]